jgi:hypothetical protein
MIETVKIVINLKAPSPFIHILRITPQHKKMLKKMHLFYKI